MSVQINPATFFAAIILASCSSPPSNDHYNAQTIDGWDVMTSMQDKANRGAIFVGLPDKLIVVISNREDEGEDRLISIFEYGSDNDGVPKIEIWDRGRDGRFDSISYIGTDHHAWDVNFDGRVDQMSVEPNGPTQIRIENTWYTVQFENGVMYIDKDGERIELTLALGDKIVPKNDE